MKILVFGMNHQSAPVEVREHFALDEPEEALRKLVSNHDIEEGVILSTCNRVEVVVTTQHPESAIHTLSSFFLHELGDGPELPGGGELHAHAYLYRDAEAVAHIFRVASAIDSMVVGEPQILGQLKDAYRDAMAAGSCGPLLSRLFQRAFATAKRVKSETGIGQRPVSVARVAVDLARQIFEDLGDKSALMIGAGEMIEMALFALQREGLGTQRVANRTRAHAESLAARFDATPHGLDELPELLLGADVVLTCIGGDGPLLSRDGIRKVLRARRRRPLFLIDIGVPRNIDPAVNDLDNAYLYDIDDLQSVAAANVEERRRESLGGERIVLEEQERFLGWMVGLQAVPTIRHLRARADRVRMREIEQAIPRLGLDDAQREGVEALTRAIMNKLLHPPLARLGTQTEREEGLAVLEEARALFGLDDPTAPGADVDAELDGIWAPTRADAEAAVAAECAEEPGAASRIESRTPDEEDGVNNADSMDDSMNNSMNNSMKNRTSNVESAATNVGAGTGSVKVADGGHKEAAGSLAGVTSRQNEGESA